MNEDTTTGTGDEMLRRLFDSEEWKTLVARVDKVCEFADRAEPIFAEIENEATGEADEAPVATPVTKPAPAAPAKADPAKEEPTKNSHGSVPVRFAARKIVADPVLAGKRLPDDYDALVRLAGRPDARALVS